MENQMKSIGIDGPILPPVVMLEAKAGGSQ